MKEILNNCYDSKTNTFILGKKYNDTVFPSHIEADIFIYENVKNVYVYTYSLFIRNNQFLTSTIHKDHNQSHINESNYFINLFKMSLSKKPI